MHGGCKDIQHCCQVAITAVCQYRSPATLVNDLRSETWKPVGKKIKESIKKDTDEEGAEIWMLLDEA